MCVGVGEVVVDWAGDGMGGGGGGFPDMKIWTFALISKRLFLFFYEKMRRLPFRNMSPITKR